MFKVYIILLFIPNRFVKPSLEAQWADAILATPIKPQQLFPYNAVPTGRSRNMELMSRSLAPQYEGLSFGLSKSQIFTSGIEMKLNQAGSNNTNINSNNAQMNPNGGNTNGTSSSSNRKNNVNDLTKSIALFNLVDSNSANSMNKTPLAPQTSATSPVLSTNNNGATPPWVITILNIQKLDKMVLKNNSKKSEISMMSININ